MDKKEILERYKEEFCSRCTREECNKGIVFTTTTNIVCGQKKIDTIARCVDYGRGD